MTDDMWRILVNSYDELDGKIGPPALETIETFAPEMNAEDNFLADDDMVFVQKIVTEVYVFTDANNQMFGEHTFQDMVVLGNMSKEKLTKLLNRQKRKREKGS